MYEQMMLPVAIGYPKLPKHQTMPQHLFFGAVGGRLEACRSMLQHAAACRITLNMLRHAGMPQHTESWGGAFWEKISDQNIHPIPEQRQPVL